MNSKKYLYRIVFSIIMRLLSIKVNIKTGEIHYIQHRRSIQCICKNLYLLRHAETYGVRNNQFMNNTSENSRLTDYGQESIKELAPIIKEFDFDYILYSDIPRVKDTVELLKRDDFNNRFVKVSFLKGINNGDWAGKSLSELNNDNKNLFYRREILHDVFCHASGGNCWSDVIMRSLLLVLLINLKYRDKKILVVSQGSILRALQILLQKYDDPWKNYEPKTMFSLLQSKTTFQYGKLNRII